MIRTLLVDDEEPARIRLRNMLTQFEDVVIEDEATDGEEALAMIDRLRPDLVFLDIQMPGLSGLEVAASLEPPRPRIVFCTAFDQYAIDAFEHHAADYLLKPVNRKRLARTIDRVRKEVYEQRASTVETEAASNTQARLLPQAPPPMDRLDYSGHCRAARGVGGDYYDFIDLGDGRLGLALGDVSGKGMFAGLLVAGLQARIQSIAPRSIDAVAEMVCEVNRRMHSATDSNRYATLFYGVWDDAARSLSYVNAGHNPPMLLRPTSGNGCEVRHLEPDGTPVGMLPEAEYLESRMTLEPGDTLLIYTDGLTEAPSPDGEEFGVARLEAFARRRLNLDATALRDAILAEVERFCSGTPTHDDLTLVVARVE